MSRPGRSLNANSPNRALVSGSDSTNGRPSGTRAWTMLSAPRSSSAAATTASTSASGVSVSRPRCLPRTSRAPGPASSSATTNSMSSRAGSSEMATTVRSTWSDRTTVLPTSRSRNCAPTVVSATSPDARSRPRPGRSTSRATEILKSAGRSSTGVPSDRREPHRAPSSSRRASTDSTPGISPRAASSASSITSSNWTRTKTRVGSLVAGASASGAAGETDGVGSTSGATVAVPSVTTSPPSLTGTVHDASAAVRARLASSHGRRSRITVRGSPSHRGGRSP